MHKFRLILIQFYRPVFAINLVYDLFLIYKRYEINFVFAVMLKLFGYALLTLLQYYSKSKTYYYFRNTGYRISLLYVSVFITDLLLFSLLYSFFTLLHYVTTTHA